MRSCQALFLQFCLFLMVFIDFYAFL